MSEYVDLNRDDVANEGLVGDEGYAEFANGNEGEESDDYEEIDDEVCVFKGIYETFWRSIRIDRRKERSKELKVKVKRKKKKKKKNTKAKAKAERLKVKRYIFALSHFISSTTTYIVIYRKRHSPTSFSAKYALFFFSGLFQ